MFRKPLLTLLFILWTCIVPARAQTSRIHLDLQNVSLQDVFKEIEKQTKYTFTYDVQRFSKEKIQSINFRNEPLKNVLDYLEKQANVAFLIVNQSISVQSKSAQPKVGSSSSVEQILRGQVLDAKTQETLPGATVQVKGSGVGTSTDAKGRFSLSVSQQPLTLVVSFIGYEPQEIPVSGQSEINVHLRTNAISMQEVVTIGYGTESRRNISTAIAKVNAEDLKDLPVSSIDQALAGRVAGVDISQANGAPGASVAINIRGISSITGGNSPLIVVDGVPLSSSTSDVFSQGQSSNGDFNVGYRINPLSAINPSDIASVEILKDAASAAIYGSRGTNGVILITTKTGQFGKQSVINLNVYGGFQAVTKKVDVMKAYDFANYSKLTRDLAWINRNPAQNSAEDPQSVRSANERIAPYLLPYLEGRPGLTDTDWQDEIFRTAPQQSYEISANGGNDWLSYFASGNYFDQKGIVINSGMKRYSARLNLKAKVSDKVKFGINFNPSFADHKIVQTEQNWYREGLIISALMYHPNLPVRNADGSLVLGQMMRTNRTGESAVALIENPVALAELIKNKMTHTRLLGNTYVEVELPANLHLKSSFGVDLNYMDRLYYRPKTLNWRTEYAPTSTFNYAWANTSSVFNWLSETTLDYMKTFGKHNLTALVGYTAQKENNKHQYLEGRNFPNDNVITLNAAQTRTGISEEREWSLLSYLGRVQYNYGGKYSVSASVRRDGSSRFGPNSKWGWFPSVSAGWHISDESFLPKLDFVSDIKVRASYGLTGNTEIPFYGGTALLGLANYVLSDQVTTGLAPVTSPNSDLSWETTRTLDVGTDINLFNNKWTFTADYYQSNTEDLLLNVTVPSSSGFQTSLRNIGRMRNQGLELALSTVQKLGDFTWNAAVNFSTNKNKVVALAPGQQQILVSGGLAEPSFIVRVGEPIGSYFGYQVNGVFRSQEEFDRTPHLENQNQKVGDFIYADVNGDGKVNPDDRTILGDNNPAYTWGFQSNLTYKKFDFGFNVQAKQRFELFNSMHRYLAETWGNNLAVYQSDAAPRPVWGVGSSSHTRPSSWHVEDGSFVRVRNITLGYTLPNAWTSKRGVKTVRLYASALNPLTFTKYSGYNPEVSNNVGDAIRSGEEFGNYPVSKSLTFGLNATF